MKTLTLFFTYGISLEDWEKSGALSRELAIYTDLLTVFDHIYFITYGKNDGRYTALLPNGITVLPKKISIRDSLYSFAIPFVYHSILRHTHCLKTNQMLGSWSAVLAHWLYRKPLLVRTGYTLSLFPPKKHYLKRFLMFWIEWIAYHSANLSIVTSHSQQSYIAHRYRANRIVVIPNGVDTQRFTPTTQPPQKVRTVKEILFVGRLHPEKNILRLVEALKDIPNIHCTIIGRGPLKNAILELRERFGLPITLLPMVPNTELPNYYQQADLYVQPSLYEGHPKTILEAMSCGLPVIGTGVAGIRDVIKHRVNGFLCETHTQAIHEAICTLLADVPLRLSIGMEARQFVKANFDLETILNQEKSLYAKLETKHKIL